MTTKSFAARLHEWMGNSGIHYEYLLADQQEELLGTVLYDGSAMVGISFELDGSIIIKHAPRSDSENWTQMTLAALINRNEDEEEPHRYERDDDLTVDYYRSFPRDEAAAVTISNSYMKTSEHVLGSSLQNAQDNFAAFRGYRDWEEMVSYAPNLRWQVSWTTGSPEENRLKTAHRTVEKNALAAIAGPDGFDAPTISRVGWLKTLLDEIDATPGIKQLLERDDHSAMTTMLRECRALADDGMAALDMLRPKFPFDIIEKPAATEAHQ